MDLLQQEIVSDSGIEKANATNNLWPALLEYATLVWSSYTITDISKTESVQRSFTKKLPALSNLPYSMRCEVFGIHSLEIRQLYYDLVFVDVKFSDYFTLRASSTTRGHDYKLFLTIQVGQYRPFAIMLNK